jgi:hypothetical protein
MTDRTAPETSDNELVVRAKAGELIAFESLANRHEQRVYSLALRMLRHEQFPRSHKVCNFSPI